jgi:hypothetical protein
MFFHLGSLISDPRKREKKFEIPSSLNKKPTRRSRIPNIPQNLKLFNFLNRYRKRFEELTNNKIF